MPIQDLFVKTTFKETAKSEERVQYWAPTLYHHISNDFFNMYDLICKYGKAQIKDLENVIIKLENLQLEGNLVKFQPLISNEVVTPYVDVISVSHSYLRGSADDINPFRYRTEAIPICHALVNKTNCNFYSVDKSYMFRPGLNNAMGAWFGEQLQAACTDEYFDMLRKATIVEYLRFFETKVFETRRSLDDLGTFIFQQQMGR